MFFYNDNNLFLFRGRTDEAVKNISILRGVDDKMAESILLVDTQASNNADNSGITCVTYINGFFCIWSI